MCSACVDVVLVYARRTHFIYVPCVCKFIILKCLICLHFVTRFKWNSQCKYGAAAAAAAVAALNWIELPVVDICMASVHYTLVRSQLDSLKFFHRISNSYQQIAKNSFISNSPEWAKSCCISVSIILHTSFEFDPWARRPLTRLPSLYERHSKYQISTLSALWFFLYRVFNVP